MNHIVKCLLSFWPCLYIHLECNILAGIITDETLSKNIIKIIIVTIIINLINSFHFFF